MVERERVDRGGIYSMENFVDYNCCIFC